MALGIKSINYIYEYLGFLKVCINKYTNKISKKIPFILVNSPMMTCWLKHFADRVINAIVVFRWYILHF